MEKMELLCPAGDLIRLKTAVDFGADAVYIAGEEFGMRTAASNFGEEDMREGIKYAHERGVKVHVACNTLPHNNEISRIPGFLEMVQDAGADAVTGDFSIESAGYIIKDGKLDRAVRSFTIAGNFFEILLGISEIADDLAIDVTGRITAFGSPSVLVKNMSVAG